MMDKPFKFFCARSMNDKHIDDGTSSFVVCANSKQSKR